MTEASEDRHHIESAIKQQQNKITDSYNQIRQLEQQADNCYEDMAEFKRVKDDHEQFVHDYQTKTAAFIEMASSYNFVIKYENRRDELLHGSLRRKAEEELCAREAAIRKNITNTEDEIKAEKRKARVLEDQLDSLEYDLRRLLRR